VKGGRLWDRKHVCIHREWSGEEYSDFPIAVDISGKRRSNTGEKVPVYGMGVFILADGGGWKSAWEVKTAERWMFL
jgi:hypothetical protein